MRRGGWPGADFCQHMGRACWEMAHAQAKSACQLFVDLRAAFASIGRQLIYRHGRTDADICEFLATFALPRDAFHQVKEILGKPAALERFVGSRHLRLLIEETLRATWFTTDGLAQPSGTTCGTKAGDPLGDLLFTVAVTLVLEEVVQRLRAAALVMNLQYDPQYRPISSS